MRAVVGQDGETGRSPVVAIEQAAVVDNHAFGKIGVRVALDLDVHQHPGFGALQGMHPRQLKKLRLVFPRRRGEEP